MVRDVQQTVRVPRDGVAEATTKVSRIVDDAGGYLASSQISETGSSAGAGFSIVVPSDKLDATVSRLSGVGRLRRLERSSTDITDEVASVGDQLKDLRADRAALRLQLAKTVDPERRAARRRALRLLSSRVARLEGEQRSLRDQVATSRIELQVTTSRTSSGATPQDDDAWGLSDAWHDAGRVLQVAGGVLLIAAAIIVPLGLLLAAVIVLTRRGRAARRNRLLDEA